MGPKFSNQSKLPKHPPLHSHFRTVKDVFYIARVDSKLILKSKLLTILHDMSSSQDPTTNSVFPISRVSNYFCSYSKAFYCALLC